MPKVSSYNHNYICIYFVRQRQRGGGGLEERHKERAKTKKDVLQTATENIYKF